MAGSYRLPFFLAPHMESRNSTMAGNTRWWDTCIIQRRRCYKYPRKQDYHCWQRQAAQNEYNEISHRQLRPSNPGSRYHKSQIIQSNHLWWEPLSQKPNGNSISWDMQLSTELNSWCIYRQNAARLLSHCFRNRNGLYSCLAHRRSPNRSNFMHKS